MARGSGSGIGVDVDVVVVALVVVLVGPRTVSTGDVLPEEGVFEVSHAGVDADVYPAREIHTRFTLVLYVYGTISLHTVGFTKKLPPMIT